MFFGLFVWRRDPNAFVEDRYGPTERRLRELRKRERWWRKHLAWIATFPITGRIVIALLWLAVAAVSAIAGAFVGLGLYFAVAS